MGRILQRTCQRGNICGKKFIITMLPVLLIKMIVYVRGEGRKTKCKKKPSAGDSFEPYWKITCLFPAVGRG